MLLQAAGDWFGAPGFGLLLPAVALLLLLLAALRSRRQRRLAAVVGRRAGALAEEHQPARMRRRDRLAAVGLAAGVLALMQPRFGEGAGAASPPGTDLCICLDVSRSMLAQDLLPSRLQVAQAAIAGLGERTRGDRLALVLFAGEARLRVPLTRDVESLVTLARGTDPTDVALGGTDLAAAIDTAVAALAAGQGRGADAALDGAVLVVSDGEDAGGAGRAAAERARGRGLRVHCVGLGSALGSKITVTGSDGKQTFLRDRQGREVVSQLHAETLRALATAGGGVYVDGGSSRAPLVEVYERGVAPALTASARRVEAGGGRQNRFQLPLALAVLLLLLELLLPQRGRARLHLHAQPQQQPSTSRAASKATPTPTPTSTPTSTMTTPPARPLPQRGTA